MKKFVLLSTLLSLLVCQGFSMPEKARKAKKPQAVWQQQLAASIVYPQVLQQIKQPGLVVISFRVNADHRLARLQVHSQDEQLNNDLIRQLTGKKVNAPESDLEKTHLVRLHFRRD